MSGRVYKLYRRSNVLAELDRLRQREALLDATEQLAKIGHREWDFKRDRIVACSDGYARLFDLSVAQVLEAQNSWDKLVALVHPDDRDDFIAFFTSPQQADSHEIEYRIQGPGGQLRHVYETAIVEFDPDGNPRSAFGLLQDISERKTYEQELEAREALANQAEAVTDIGHYICDELNKTYTYISPGFARILAVDPEDYMRTVSSSDDDVEDVHPDDRDKVLEAYRRACDEGGGYSLEYRIIRGDGQLRWIREQTMTQQNDEGKTVQTIGVLQDITEHKQIEQSLREARDSLESMVRSRTRKLAETVERLEAEIREREKIAAELDFLANHDALTGLPSLRLCKDRLQHSLAEARRSRQLTAVMFLDLDGFKLINDTHGHEFGDQVLKATADRIRAEIRETDTVARIGGDEFIIILTSLPELEIAERISAELNRRIAKPIRIEDETVSVSASIGIAIYPDDGSTAEELMRNADRAMYRVKDSGKNDFGFAANAPAS